MNIEPKPRTKITYDGSFSAWQLNGKQKPPQVTIAPNGQFIHYTHIQQIGDQVYQLVASDLDRHNPWQKIKTTGRAGSMRKAPQRG